MHIKVLSMYLTPNNHYYIITINEGLWVIEKEINIFCLGNLENIHGEDMLWAVGWRSGKIMRTVIRRNIYLDFTMCRYHSECLT